MTALNDGPSASLESPRKRGILKKRTMFSPKSSDRRLLGRPPKAPQRSACSSPLSHTDKEDESSPRRPLGSIRRTWSLKKSASYQGAPECMAEESETRLNAANDGVPRAHTFEDKRRSPGRGGSSFLKTFSFGKDNGASTEGSTTDDTDDAEDELHVEVLQGAGLLKETNVHCDENSASFEVSLTSQNYAENEISKDIVQDTTTQNTTKSEALIGPPARVNRTEIRWVTVPARVDEVPDNASSAPSAQSSDASLSYKIAVAVDPAPRGLGDAKSIESKSKSVQDAMQILPDDNTSVSSRPILWIHLTSLNASDMNNTPPRDQPPVEISATPCQEENESRTSSFWQYSEDTSLAGSKISLNSPRDGQQTTGSDNGSNKQSTGGLSAPASQSVGSSLVGEQSAEENNSVGGKSKPSTNASVEGKTNVAKSGSSISSKPRSVMSHKSEPSASHSVGSFRASQQGAEEAADKSVGGKSSASRRSTNPSVNRKTMNSGSSISSMSRWSWRQSSVKSRASEPSPASPSIQSNVGNSGTQNAGTSSASMCSKNSKAKKGAVFVEADGFDPKNSTDQITSNAKGICSEVGSCVSSIMEYASSVEIELQSGASSKHTPSIRSNASCNNTPESQKSGRSNASSKQKSIRSNGPNASSKHTPESNKSVRSNASSKRTPQSPKSVIDNDSPGSTSSLTRLSDRSKSSTKTQENSKSDVEHHEQSASSKLSDSAPRPKSHCSARKSESTSIHSGPVVSSIHMVVSDLSWDSASENWSLSGKTRHSHHSAPAAIPVHPAVSAEEQWSKSGRGSQAEVVAPSNIEKDSSTIVSDAIANQAAVVLANVNAEKQGVPATEHNLPTHDPFLAKQNTTSAETTKRTVAVPFGVVRSTVGPGAIASDGMEELTSTILAQLEKLQSETSEFVLKIAPVVSKQSERLDASLMTSVSRARVRSIEKARSAAPPVSEIESVGKQRTRCVVEMAQGGLSYLGHF